MSYAYLQLKSSMCKIKLRFTYVLIHTIISVIFLPMYNFNKNY